jgi:hypothetical protein
VQKVIQIEPLPLRRLINSLSAMLRHGALDSRRTQNVVDSNIGNPLVPVVRRIDITITSSLLRRPTF